MAVNADTFANLTAAQKAILTAYFDFGVRLANGERPALDPAATHKQATKVLNNVHEIIDYLKFAASAARFIIDKFETDVLTTIRTDSNS